MHKSITRRSSESKSDPLTDIFNTREVRVYRNRFPLPNHFRSSFRFYEQVNFTAVTTPQVYVFRGNSPYDPDQTGTGLQPQGWDDMITWYESSYCIGSEIKIRFYNAATGPLQVGLVSTPQSSSLTTFLEFNIYPNMKLTTCDGTSRGGTSYGTLTRKQSTLGFFGGNFDRDYIATGQAVAGKQFYWTSIFNAPDGVSALSFSIQVEIYYDIVFFDRKAKALS